MPLWEQYDVEVETSVKIKADGKLIAAFTVPGTAKGGSNELLDKVNLTGAVEVALGQAAARAINLTGSTRVQRRKEIGYGD